jgi:hypothetical protein
MINIKGLNKALRKALVDGVKLGRTVFTKEVYKNTQMALRAAQAEAERRYPK